MTKKSRKIAKSENAKSLTDQLLLTQTADNFFAD